jgi:hypothetical protein
MFYILNKYKIKYICLLSVIYDLQIETTNIEVLYIQLFIIFATGLQQFMPLTMSIKRVLF